MLSQSYEPLRDKNIEMNVCPAQAQICLISNFNYCPLAWHFCSVSSTNNLEKVQERAMRFINNDYASTINDLLKSTNTQPLHVRRLKQMACEVFKIVIP